MLVALPRKSLKTNYFQHKHNSFVQSITSSRGLKFKILFIISILFKFPFIIWHTLRNLFLKKKKYLYLEQRKLLEQLQYYGFTMNPRYILDKNTTYRLREDFYQDYQQSININGNECSVMYKPLRQTNIKIIMEQLVANIEPIINSYMYYSPYLKHIFYMYSDNNTIHANSSQHWHLDKQGPKTLKIFIALHDLTNDHGPLTFIDSNASAYLDNSVKYQKIETKKRIHDSEFDQALVGIPSQVINFTGDEGSLLFLDTDRCFHFGSRKSSYSRLLLLIEFGSLLDFKLPETSRYRPGIISY